MITCKKHIGSVMIYFTLPTTDKGLKLMKQKCIEFLTNLTPEAAIQLTSIAV